MATSKQSKRGRKEAKIHRKQVRTKTGGKIGGKAIKSAPYKRFQGYVKPGKKSKYFSA